MDIRHEDVRILREAMSKIATNSIGELREYTISKLKEYGQSVGKYCDHEDRVRFVNFYACLDCGLRMAIEKELHEC